MFSERYQVDLFFMYTLMRCVAHSLTRTAYFFYPKFPGTLIQWVFLLTTSYQPALFALFLIIMRSLVWHYVCEVMVREDRFAYKLAWEDVMREGHERKALENLEQACLRASSAIKGSDKDPPRQNYWHDIEAAGTYKSQSYTAGVSHGALANGENGAALVPVSSLNQLYDQAAFLDAFLRDKVVDVGKASNGYFAVQCKEGADKVGAGKYEKFSMLRDERFPRTEIGWAPLKCPQRALEKLLRCYNSDASLLLDCCRHRIVYERITDVLAGLEALVADPEIRIVRFKNRMSSGNIGEANPKRSGGFRYLLLSLHATQLVIFA